MKTLNASIRAMFIVTGIVSLTACNTGGTSGSTSTGTFVDSAVAGVSYKTDTHSGKTDANGQYHYEPGETVTFSIGGVTLPSVTAKSVVTPFDMASSSSDTKTPLNIGLLLQSYDKDGDPSNGIEITDAVEKELENVTLGKAELSSYDTNTFKSMFTGSLAPSSWKTDSEVEHHLENADGIVGSWILKSASASGLVYLRITTGGQYLLLSDQTGTSNDVLQAGTYTVDRTNETITFTKVTGTASTSLVSGTAYHYSDSDDLDELELTLSDGETKFKRLVSLKSQAKTADALNGAWKFDKTGSITHDKLAVFNKDGSYEVFSLEGDSTTGAVIYEKGSYTITPGSTSTTGAFSFTADSTNPLDDGAKGFSGTSLNQYAVSGSTLTLSVSGSNAVTLTKMLPY
ncbi:MAG: hypothetical protein R3219_06335 [Hydrogenovibrio sp.]|nr:hypothetical protein [Hydrogenovibrio sp.]